jgi:S1-C subfamily serine protease
VIHLEPRSPLAAGRHAASTWAIAALLGTAVLSTPTTAVAREPEAQPAMVQMIDRTQQSQVKLYGAGGLRGLEAYQSGVLVAREGLVVTSWSTVLDTDRLRVVTWDGRAHEAELIGSDPLTELALLSIPTTGYPFLSLADTPSGTVGQRVFGISNLFGIAAGSEPASAQAGVIMARAPLAARRGRGVSAYQGPVYVIDVMTNNPGATGGALVDLDGQLLGILGREFRDAQLGIFLNYALPVDVVAEAVAAIEAGIDRRELAAQRGVADRPQRIERLGLILLPDILPRTPAFIDAVAPNSPAAKAGLKPDDLLLMVGGLRIESRAQLLGLLESFDQADRLVFLLQRGESVIELEVRP